MTAGDAADDRGDAAEEDEMTAGDAAEEDEMTAGDAAEEDEMTAPRGMLQKKTR